MSSFQWKAGDRFNRGRAGQCRPVLGQEDSRSTIACCTAEFQPSPEARLCPSWVSRRHQTMSATRAAFLRSGRRVRATVAPPTTFNRACGPVLCQMGQMTRMVHFPSRQGRARAPWPCRPESGRAKATSGGVDIMGLSFATARPAVSAVDVASCRFRRPLPRPRLRTLCDHRGRKQKVAIVRGVAPGAGVRAGHAHCRSGADMEGSSMSEQRAGSCKERPR